jgi:hypothetical protein
LTPAIVMFVLVSASNAHPHMPITFVAVGVSPVPSPIVRALLVFVVVRNRSCLAAMDVVAVVNISNQEGMTAYLSRLFNEPYCDMHRAMGLCRDHVPFLPVQRKWRETASEWVPSRGPMGKSNHPSFSAVPMLWRCRGRLSAYPVMVGARGCPMLHFSFRPPSYRRNTVRSGHKLG